MLEKLSKKPLGIKLLLATWLVSSIGTFLFTAVQIYLDYSAAQEKRLRTFEVVEKGYLETLSESLWSLDRSLVESQALGISRLEGVAGVRITDSNGRIYFRVGQESSPTYISKIYPLKNRSGEGHIEEHLGSITVDLDLASLRQEFIFKSLQILLIQGTKAFLVSTILYLIFIKIVVSRIVAKTKSIQDSKFGKEIDVAEEIGHDELTFLIETMNKLITKYETAIEDLEESKASLELKVQERTADLESFSYSVAHDLRSPLRSINGFSTLLLQDYAKELPDEAKEFLQRITSASVKMGNLIEDILNISKLSKQSVSVSTFSISEVAQQIVESKIEIYRAQIYEVSVEEGLSVKADQHMTQVILDNLLENAFKYSSKTQHPKISFYFDKAQKCYVVEDNGVGFDMKYVSKIFEIFQRLHSQHEFHGTGVGLATVERLVRKHHGKIWADSKPNISTKFYFTLES